MNTSLAFASIIIISVFGLALYGSIAAAEKIFMPWRVRSGAVAGLGI